MGTSKRNVSEKIKEILRDVPLEKIHQNAPEVSKHILTISKINNEFFDENTFIESIYVIKNQFKSIAVNGYNGKPLNEIIKNPITLDELINIILDEIDKADNLFIGKSIVEKSFKIAMTECLQNEDVVINKFVNKLFYNIVKQILTKELFDTLKDIYDELDYKKIDEIIDSMTDQIVNTSIFEKVELFLEKKITLEEVLKKVTEQTEKVTLGEF